MPRNPKRRPPGYTPSLPGCGPELIRPVSVKGEALPATCFPGSFLSGFPHAEVNDKPPFGSAAWWRNFDNYCASDVWKRRRDRRCVLANHQCSEDGCPRPATECHHLNYDRWSKGEELDSDLAPLCKPHHEIADARRRRESKRERAKKAAADYDEAGFRWWVRREYGGTEFLKTASYDALCELRAEYDDWQCDREGDDYE